MEHARQNAAGGVGPGRGAEIRNIPGPQGGRITRYNRHVKQFALRSLIRGTGRQVAGMISAHCSVQTPLRWRREQEDTADGRRMLGLMIANVGNGRPIDHDIEFPG